MSDENDGRDVEDGGDGGDGAADAQDVAAGVADASPADMEQHRGMLGGVLEQLRANGIDVDDLARRAGISGADVDALTHGDLVTLAQYVATNHPEVLQQVAADFPAAQGLLGMLGGGSGPEGSAIGGLIGRFLGGGR